MKHFIGKHNIYIIFWVLYLLQGALYQSGGILSRLILCFLLTWSILAWYNVNTKVKSLPAYFKATNIFLLFTTIYGLFLIFSGKELYITEDEYIKVSNFDYLKNVYVSFLPIYVFYDYANRGLLDEEQIRKYTVFFLILTIGLFFYSRHEMLLSAIERRSSQTEFTNNLGYNFLQLIPLMFLWYKKPIKQYILLVVCLLFILVCMKRGAILSALLCFLFVIYCSLKTVKGKYRLVLLGIISVAFLILYNSVSGLISTSEYFVGRIEQTISGDSSYRDYIYKSLFNHFTSEQNILRFLFGNGANATLSIGINYAHNDWLELAINNGIMGVCIYIWYFIALYKGVLNMRNTSVMCSNILSVSFIILFMASLFSMSYNSITIPLALAIGYSLGYPKHINT